MRLERLRLEELSAASGFLPNVLEKVLRLGDLAADVARHPLLGAVLLLKGGTALNLCFGPPKRLSVDLDFNYVGTLDRAEMLRRRPEVEGAVELLARRKRYEIQRSRDEHAGRKFFLRYRSAQAEPERIEIDLNYLFREPLEPAETRELWQPGGVQPPLLKTVGLAELIAGKVCALLDRVAARDLFDVGLLPSIAGHSWPEPRLRKLIIAFSAILDHPLDRYTRDRFERVTDRVVEEQLSPMLSREQEVSAEELRNRAWAVLEPILTLSPEEQEYTRLVQQGELRPELLFGEEADLTQRLMRNPALQWKVRNARKALDTR